MGIADLSTHQNVLNASFQKAYSGLSERAGVTEVMVSLTDGIQAGQSRRICTPTLMIGSEDTNDLILLDPSVAAAHVSVTFQRSVFGTLVNVKALADGVRVDDSDLEKDAERDAMRLPVEIGIGGNTVLLDREDGKRNAKPSAKAKPERRKADPVVLYAFSTICLLFIGYVLLSKMTPERAYAVEVTSNTETPVVSVALDAEWVAMTKAKAAAFNLENEIDISQQSDNLIYIYGRIPESKLPELRELQAWVDGQPAAPTFVWDVRRQAALRDMPQIAMVLTSEPRRLILSNGQVKPVGDTLVDDWIVSEIGETSMTVARGSEEIIITYESLLP